jgi:hypothetical protein
MKIRTIGAVVVLALSFAACGNDEAAASEAISKSIMDSNDESFKVTKDEADCVGDGLVDQIGVDKLTEYGIITEDLESSGGINNVEMSQGDAESAADVMADCADIKQIFTSAMGELPEEAKACVDENLNDDVIHEFLVAIFMNDQEGGQQGVMTALQECMTAGG